MKKKLLSLFPNYWRAVKRHIKARLKIQKYRSVLAVSQLLADLITNATIVLILLLVIFLTSITLSFSLSVFFGSHVLGFLAATLCLTLAALLVLWKRSRVETYFAGLTIARYFEKIKAGHAKRSVKNTSEFDSLMNVIDQREKR